MMDRHFPRLTILELDLDPDGTWVSLKDAVSLAWTNIIYFQPYESIDSIAMGSRNLRQLSIHVALGITRLPNGPRTRMTREFVIYLTKTDTENFA